MADFIGRYPKNIPGKFYTDSDCSDCDLCRELAPSNFGRDDERGISYVYKQPTTPEEFALCEESRELCPMEAIGNDGDKFDWHSTPIRDWRRCAEELRTCMEGLNILTPEQECLMPKTFNLK